MQDEDTQVQFLSEEANREDLWRPDIQQQREQLFYMDKTAPSPTLTDTCTHLERQGYHLSEAVIS